MVELADGVRVLLGQPAGRLPRPTLRCSRFGHVRSDTRCADARRLPTSQWPASIASAHWPSGRPPLSDQLLARPGGPAAADHVDGAECSGREASTGLAAASPRRRGHGRSRWSSTPTVTTRAPAKRRLAERRRVQAVAAAGGGTTDWWVFDATAEDDRLAGEAGLRDRPGSAGRCAGACPPSGGSSVVTRPFVVGQRRGGLAGRQQPGVRRPRRAGRLDPRHAAPARARAVVRPGRLPAPRARRRLAGVLLDEAAQPTVTRDPSIGRDLRDRGRPRLPRRSGLGQAAHARRPRVRCTPAAPTRACCTSTPPTAPPVDCTSVSASQVTHTDRAYRQRHRPSRSTIGMTHEHRYEHRRPRPRRAPALERRRPPRVVRRRARSSTRWSRPVPTSTRIVAALRRARRPRHRAAAADAPTTATARRRGDHDVQRRWPSSSSCSRRTSTPPSAPTAATSGPRRCSASSSRSRSGLNPLLARLADWVHALHGVAAAPTPSPP